MTEETLASDAQRLRFEAKMKAEEAEALALLAVAHATLDAIAAKLRAQGL